MKSAKTRPQLLTAQEYTYNPFEQRNLRANSSYLYENEEFHGGRGRGYPCCNMCKQGAVLLVEVDDRRAHHIGSLPEAHVAGIVRHSGLLPGDHVLSGHVYGIGSGQQGSIGLGLEIAGTRDLVFGWMRLISVKSLPCRRRRGDSSRALG